MKKLCLCLGLMLFVASGSVFAEEGYVVLDSMGGVHTAGTLEAMPDGPYMGWDIARDLVLAPEGDGYYLLNGDGRIYSVGDIDPLAQKVFGWDIARKLVLGNQGHYILDGFGVVHALAGAPELPYEVLGQPLAVDFEMTSDGSGGYVLDALGGIHCVGR